MTIRRVGLVVGMVALAACAAPAEGTAASGSDIEEAAAPLVAIEGHLASCTATGADVVTVACTDLSGKLPTPFLTSVEIADAAGHTSSFELWDAPTGEARATAFPLKLTIHTSKSATAPLVGLDVTEITQTITVGAPTTSPIDVRLPYDFWPVTVSTSDFSTVSVAAQDAAIAPWATDSGDGTAKLADAVAVARANAPASLTLAVPTGARSIAASFDLGGGRTLMGAFDGPGSYVVGAAGLARKGAPEPTGNATSVDFGTIAENLLACDLGASSVDGQRVTCSTRGVPGVTLQAMTAGVRNADGLHANGPLPGSGDTTVGLCIHGPCAIEGQAVFGVGPGLSVHGSFSLPLGGGPARLRVPFDVWTVAIDYAGKDVASVAIGSDARPSTGDGWTDIDGSVIGTLAAGKSFTSGTVLVPVGTTSLPANVTGIDLVARKVVKTTGTIARGVRYTVADDFTLVAAP